MLEIICNLSAIAGFLLSIFNLIFMIKQNQKKLRVRFGDIGITNLTGHKSVFKVLYSFENLSQLPISITRVQIQVEGTLYDCERLPFVVEESVRKVNNEVVDRTVLKSVSLPVNLPALGAESGYLAFVIPRDILSRNDKDLIFRICTNRGKATQMTFSRYEDELIR